MKKEDAIQVALMFAALFFLIIFVFTFLAVIEETENVKECKKLSSYGFITKLEGSFPKHCKVLVEEGFYISASDLDIQAYERFEPVRVS